MNSKDATVESAVTDKSDLRLPNRNTRGRESFHPNAKDVTKAIAARIVESNVRLTKNLRARLAEIMEHGYDSGQISLELERGGYRVTVYAGPDYLWNSSDWARDDLPKDGAGNTFQHRTLAFGINWAAYGTQDAGDTLVFSELLRDAATLCAELKAEFGKTEVYDCSMTAAEIVASAQKKAQRDFECKVKRLVQENWKNMRVDQERSVFGQFESDDPIAARGPVTVTGEYEREYVATVTPVGTLCFSRVK